MDDPRAADVPHHERLVLDGLRASRRHRRQARKSGSSRDRARRRWMFSDDVRRGRRGPAPWIVPAHRRPGRRLALADPGQAGSSALRPLRDRPRRAVARGPAGALLRRASCRRAQPRRARPGHRARARGRPPDGDRGPGGSEPLPRHRVRLTAMAERIGRYEDLEVIGRGGMGMIYKARDPVLERSVALKVISSVEITPDLRARFYREARACARLRDHPNIITIYDMGEDAGRLFIVMELLEGEELRRLIARHAPLTLNNKLDILRQICDGLYHAHQRGIVHRDIQPANIFLLPAGQVKILDFGIAQLAAAAATTHGDLTRGMMMGTPRYMAPEQVRGQADYRSDIFSVGAVAYELFSGRPPFTGEHPMEILEQLRTATPARLSELDPRLPPELSDIVDRAMHKESEARFADLGEMGREVEAVRRALGVVTKRVQALESPTPTLRTASVVSPTDDAVEPLAARTEHAEPTDRLTSRHAATARDTGEPVSRAPRIAIATGVGIAAIVVAAFLYWQAPSTPSGTVADQTAAPAADAVKKVSEEPPRSSEISLPSATSGTSATKTEREIKTSASDAPAPPVPASSAPAPASPPASKQDKPSPPAREREKTAAVARAPSGPREDAEQARLRMADAKRA